jgi:hypothetical protein
MSAEWDGQPYDVAPAIGVGLGNGRLNRILMVILGPAQVGSGIRPSDGPGGPGRAPEPMGSPPSGPGGRRHRRRPGRRVRLVAFCRAHLRLSRASHEQATPNRPHL